MATLIIFILILITGLFSCFKKHKTSLFFLVLTIISFIWIGGGFFPHTLLAQLQTEFTPLNQPQWQKENTLVLLGAGAVRVPKTRELTPSMAAYSRIYETARLYFSCKKSLAYCHIIVSGGDAVAAGKSEADIYRDALVNLGVQQNDIELEAKSLNTYQNAKFTSAILQKENAHYVVLITSAIHMQRALLYFANFGIAPVPAPADYLSAVISYLPIGYNFLIADFALHEYLGIVRIRIYNFMGWNKNAEAAGAL